MKNVKKNRGTVIIIVLISLMTLSTTAVIFVRLSNNERRIASNFTAQVYAKLTAYAGMDHALGVVFQELLQGNVLRSPILYPKNTLKLSEAVLDALPVSLHNGILREKFSHSGLVGVAFGKKRIGTYEVNGNFYALKITNDAGKLNVNSHIAINSGDQNISNQVLRNILISLAKRCGIVNISSIVEAIVSKKIIKNARFSSFSELEKLLLVFEKNEAIKSFLENLSVNSSSIKSFGVHQLSSRKIHQAPIYYSEMRSPIDINSASFELLCSVIENIKATAMFYPVKINSKSVDNLGKRTETQIEDSPAFFSLNFSDVNIEEIATAIQQRVSFIGAFRTFKEFSLFIDDNLIAKNFQSPPQDVSPDKWLDAWHDAMKSNFNSNVTDNFWNPNDPLYRRVAKGDLFHVFNLETVPGHTTEFTFFNLGPINITSLGYVTAQNQIVAQQKFSLQAHWGEILRHTSQKDFEGTFAKFNNTISIPNNITKWGKGQSNLISGGVEPKALIAQNGLFSTGDTFTDEELFDTNKHILKANFSYFGKPFNDDQTLRANVPKINNKKLMTIFPIINEQNNDQLSRNHLSHEGLVSRRAFYADKKDSRYFLVHGLSKNTLTTDFRNKNTLQDSHIANYQGAIEFWLKLDETPGKDSKPGLTFGLVSATSKNKIRKGNLNIKQQESKAYTKQESLQNGAFHEGTQTYLFINSFGKMRFSRLYYSYAFTLDENGITHYGVTNTNDLDKERSAIRRDMEVDVASLKWQAHEWHHIIMRWNDRTDRFELELDGRVFDQSLLSSTVTDGIGVLNEVDPRDTLFINGYSRNEARSGGYFSFARKIEYPGNATIDAFVSHDSDNKGKYRSRYSGKSVYKNSFNITKRCILGPVFWVAYDSFRANKELGIVASRIKVTLSDDFIAESIEQIARPKNIVVHDEGKIEYKVNFFPGRKRNNAIECPTFDSISQVLFFTYPTLIFNVK